MNPYSSGVVGVNEYMEANFLVVVNCKKLKLNNGALQLRLQFDSAIEEKRVLLYVPVYEKRLVFHQHLDVTVE